jgi:hypothetical protein
MRYPCFLLLFCLMGLLCQAQTTGKDSIVAKTLFDTTHRIIPEKQDTIKFNGKRKAAVIKQITVDTAATANAVKKDTLVKKKHDPRKATLRSLMIPGWGQAYNREYWKIPLVYAAVGIPIGTFFYNNTWYKRTRDAYTIVVNGQTANYSKIDPKLITSSGAPLDAYTLQYLRNNFRRDRDYSVLITLLAWGLNVVDATVFGHLKDFDVSSDLSMKIQPGYDPVFKSPNLGLVFNFKSKHHREITLP